MFNRLKAELFPPVDPFDVERGVKTSGVQSLFWTRIFSGKRKETGRYQPVDEAFFDEAIQVAPRDWTFVDMGCGKGRALILAYEAGFRKIVGVDFSASLCSTARKNLAKLGIKASVECADATRYRLPEEPCVVLLYNPFGPKIIGEMLRHIGTEPRMLVYVNPVHESAFHELLPGPSGEHFRVYLSNCSGQPPLAGEPFQPSL